MLLLFYISIFAWPKTYDDSLHCITVFTLMNTLSSKLILKNWDTRQGLQRQNLLFHHFDGWKIEIHHYLVLKKKEAQKPRVYLCLAFFRMRAFCRSSSSSRRMSSRSSRSPIFLLYCSSFICVVKDDSMPRRSSSRSFLYLRWRSGVNEWMNEWKYYSSF